MKLKMEIGDLVPLRQLHKELENWEEKVRARPLPDADPVVQALGTVRQKLEDAIERARNIEFELTPEQYAQLCGLSLDALYKRWQRGQLPEAQMRGRKLYVPIKAVTDDVAA